MALITQYDKKDFGALLASDKIDGSKGVLFKKMDAANDGVEGIEPNDKDITILIGIGGTGIKTLDYVMAEISKKMKPTWSNRIAFLGIDSDYNEVEAARYLKRSDCITVTDPAISQKINHPGQWPNAWHPIAHPEIVRTQLNNPHQAGAGRSRLQGKLKLHDKPAAEKGFDEKIVERLERLKASMGVLNDRGRYQVYVIGSVCGGTCSGAFLEMPALIRQAIRDSKLSIYAMLYLPDTLTSVVDNAHEIKANGFASLKELDYFAGLRMRRGTKECWYYNDRANPKLEITSDQRFYEMPYLIGTHSGGTAASAKLAQETIAEFLISILGRYSVPDGQPFLVESFLVNAMAHESEREGGTNPFKQKDGTRHNAPKCYGTIGFAESSAPIKTVRAYMVSEVCKNAGIKALSKEEWDSVTTQATASGAAGFVAPFRGENHYLGATEGTQKARKIVEPLEKLLKEVVYNGYCNLAEEFDFTWENVKNQKMYDDSSFLSAVKTMHEKYCDEAATKEMSVKIRNAFTRFSENIKEYVLEDGPLAYVNLYDGRFVPANGENGMGIKEMLRNICAGKKADGSKYPLCGVQNAQQAEATARDTMIHYKLNPIELAKKLAGNDDPSGKIEDWKNAVQATIIARINEERGKLALGYNNLFDTWCVTPAAQLRDNLQAFGHILNQMVDIYSKHGGVVANFEDFNDSTDNASEVNLAGIDPKSYNWIKRQADNEIKAVAAKAVRSELVESFFSGENMSKWLEIPENTVKVESGKASLVNKDVAVPAREMFDSVMAEAVPNNLNVSIESLFAQVAVSPGDYDELARKIVTQLAQKSKPLFNGQCPENYFNRSIMYPASLNNAGAAGTQVIEALKSAARYVFHDAPVNVYGSDDTDTIRMYQLVAPMEMYNLAELTNWEKEYETRLGEVKHMHGYSPSTECVINDRGDASYMDPRPWSDYPSPCVYPNGAKNTRDPMTSQIIREGKRQMQIDKLIDEAKKLGILYIENEGSGNANSYVVKRVYFDPLSCNWGFNIDRLPTLSNGFYPTGKKLVEAVAKQNRKTLDEITQPVRLDTAGLLAEGASSEAYAWEYAAEVLYVHIPMLDDITASVAWFREKTEEVRLANELLMKMWMPAQFVHILRAGLVYEADGPAWKVKTDNGDEQFVRLAQTNLKIMPPKFRAMVNGGMRFAYIYMKLNSFLDTLEEGVFGKLYNEAKDEYNKLIMEIDRGNMDAEEDMAIWVARVDPLLAEIDLVKSEFGANFSQENMNRSFKEKMAELGIPEADAQKVFDFYRRAEHWEEFGE